MCFFCTVNMSGIKKTSDNQNILNICISIGQYRQPGGICHVCQDVHPGICTYASSAPRHSWQSRCGAVVLL